MNVCPKMYIMSGFPWSKLHEADAEVAANHSQTQQWQDKLLALGQLESEAIIFEHGNLVNGEED